MKILAIIDLVENIVQFMNFSIKLISKLVKLHQFSKNALTENFDTETVTNHLVLLNNKLKDKIIIADNEVLNNLCESCDVVVRKLLKTLNKVKMKDKKEK